MTEAQYDKIAARFGTWSVKAKPAPQSKPSSCACYITCGVGGRSEAAHTGTDGAMSQKASDYSCDSLCSDCHTRASGAYHRIGKRAFEQRHGLCFAPEGGLEQR